MAMSDQERKADPRWAEAGNLFDAQLTQTPWWSRLSAHAQSSIRYLTQEAALGIPDSGYSDPDGALESTVAHFVKMNAFGRSLLSQCRSIARSAARAGTGDQETGS
jgi:hypothetical protein